jgi:hypothetical protein
MLLPLASISPAADEKIDLALFKEDSNVFESSPSTAKADPTSPSGI